MPMPRGRSGPRCRSIVSIPEAKEARTVPPGDGDREGDLGDAVIGLTVPGKAVSQHHHPLRLSIPLSDQDRTGSKLGPLLVKAGQMGGHGWSCFLRSRSIEHLQRYLIEIAEAISLEAIGDDRKQQMPRQMRRGWSPEDTLPARAQSPEIETAQMRDLGNDSVPRATGSTSLSKNAASKSNVDTSRTVSRACSRLLIGQNQLASAF